MKSIRGRYALSSVGGSEDSTDADGVLVDEIDSLLRIDHETVLSAVHKALLDIKVPSRLLPAHLHRRVHDEVGVVVGLALGLPLIGPQLLHSEHTEHDALGAANGRRAHGARLPGRGAVEQPGDHGHASVLDVGADGVLFVVDEVLAEGIDHELLGFVFLVGMSVWLFNVCVFVVVIGPSVAEW